MQDPLKHTHKYKQTHTTSTTSTKTQKSRLKNDMCEFAVKTCKEKQLRH